MFAERIKQHARELGFDLVGIAPAARPPEAAFYRQWLERGFAGEMAYMARNVEKRQDCRLLFPPARSVIVCGLSYHYPLQTQAHTSEEKENSAPPLAGGARGGGTGLQEASRYSNSPPSPPDLPHQGGGTRKPTTLEPERRRLGYIATYARGDEYHTELKKRLFSLLDAIRRESAAPVEAKVCVDTVPILERLHGYYAGLGWIGKHGGLIHPHYGSWVLLGEILLDLDLDYDRPQPDRCGECRRCLDACPSGALMAPRLLDARRCLSYLTIEYRGIIPDELRAPLGNCIFGCDRCQSVCPWNHTAAPGRTKALFPREPLIAPGLDWLAALSREEFRQAFRNNPVKRSKLQGLLRNTAIAIGNSGNPALLPALKRLHAQSDELVLPHSAWAIQKLEHDKLS